jgi:hypothetical protein
VSGHFGEINTVNFRATLDSSKEKVRPAFDRDLYQASDPHSRTLDALATATAHNDWMFSIFRGIYSKSRARNWLWYSEPTCRLVEKAKEVTAIDIHPEYLRLLSRVVQAPEGYTVICGVRTSLKT